MMIGRIYLINLFPSMFYIEEKGLFFKKGLNLYGHRMVEL